MNAASTSSNPPVFFEDYESEFEYDVEVGEKRKARHDLAIKTTEKKLFKPSKQTFHEECSREQGKFKQQAFLALDAYTRHKKLINDYVLCYRGATEKLKRNITNCKTDYDIIRENHKFLWDDEADEARTWGQKLAKLYYDRLFKEYCLCDLSRYKEKKIGMRWRTEKELVIGKGQFFCGNVHCNVDEDLNTWEVLFGYVEQGLKKNALVKLRLCDTCSEKLHYGYKGKVKLKMKNKKKKMEDDNLASGDSEISLTEDKHEDLNDTHIWKQPIKEDVKQSKEDVYSEFLEDMFL